MVRLQTETERKKHNSIHVTPEMTEAGEARLRWLLDAGTGSAYIVDEVFKAMAAVAPAINDIPAKS